MERFDTLIKGFTAAVGGLVSYLVGGFGMLPVLLAGFMIVDFITGLMASKYTGKTIESKIGIKGVLKKLYILLLLWCIYRIEGVGLDVLGLDMRGFTGDAVAIMFLAMELISILENGTKMNTNFPVPLRIFIKKLNKFLNGRNDNDRSI